MSKKQATRRLIIEPHEITSGGVGWLNEKIEITLSEYRIGKPNLEVVVSIDFHDIQCAARIFNSIIDEAQKRVDSTRAAMKGE